MNENSRKSLASILLVAAGATVGGGVGWKAREIIPSKPECALTPSQARAQTPFHERLTGRDTGVAKGCIAAKGLIVEIHADDQNQDARAQAKKIVGSIEQIVQPRNAEAVPVPQQ